MHEWANETWTYIIYGDYIIAQPEHSSSHIIFSYELTESGLTLNELYRETAVPATTKSLV